MKKLLSFTFAFFLSAQVIAGGASGASFEPKPYLGLGAHNTEIDGFAGDNSDSGISFFGGMQLNRNLALEIGYTDLGTFNSGLNTDVDAFYFVAVGILPMNDRWNLTGRIGFASWESDRSGLANADGTDLVFGVGVTYKITKTVSVTGDYMVFDINGDDADVLSIGIKFNLSL